MSAPLLPGAHPSVNSSPERPSTARRRSSLSLENRRSLPERLREEALAKGVSMDDLPAAPTEAADGTPPPPPAAPRRWAHWAAIALAAVMGLLAVLSTSHDALHDAAAPPADTHGRDLARNPDAAADEEDDEDGVEFEDANAWASFFHDLGGTGWDSSLSKPSTERRKRKKKHKRRPRPKTPPPTSSTGVPANGSQPCTSVEWATYPCECYFALGESLAHVTCTDDGRFVTGITLRNNFVVGQLKRSTLGLFSPALTSLSITLSASNVGQVVGDGKWMSPTNKLPCLDAPECRPGGRISTCIVPPPLCHTTGLGVWRALYDATGGANWKRCSGKRDDPCACSELVSCIFENFRSPVGIGAIRLTDNNLNGVIPSQALAQSVLAGQALDLRLDNNPNLVGGDHDVFKCVDLPPCAVAGGVVIATEDATPGVWLCSLPAGVKLCDGASDLGSWWALWDVLQSAERLPTPTLPACSRETPCSCAPVVQCDLSGPGDARITLLDTRSLLPKGVHLPPTRQRLANNNVLARLDQLHFLDVSGMGAFLHSGCLLSPLLCVYHPESCSGPICGLLSPPAAAAAGAAVVSNNNQKKKTTNTTPIPTTPDLQLWHTFFDQLSGTEWDECQDAREDPCTLCAMHVECTSPDNYVSGLGLARMGLHGTISDSLIPSFSRLVYVDLSNTAPDGTLNVIHLDHTPVHPDNATSNDDEPTCYTLEYCSRPGVFCDFGNTPLCTDAESTAQPSRAPSTFPEDVLHPDDLQAWHRFYDATSGASWSQCSQHRDTPCQCNEEGRFVMCENVPSLSPGLRIVEMDLSGNALRGTISASHLLAFPALHGPLILSNSARAAKKDMNKLASNDGPKGCIALQAECDEQAGGRLAPCWFNRNGLSKFCDVTASPHSASPTTLTTASPTIELQCVTDGGYVPGDSLCAAPTYTIDGKGPYSGCTSMDVAQPYLSLTETPRPPRFAEENRFRWCPTVQQYSTTRPRKGADTRQAWGYCRCQPKYTPKPTPQDVEPQEGPVFVDLAAWQAFYDALDGLHWFVCGNRVSPCENNPGCQLDPLRTVTCEVRGDRVFIKTIVMRNNNVRGQLPSEAIARMTALTKLDLSNDKKSGQFPNSITFSGPCMDIPLCMSRNSAACDFDGALTGKGEAGILCPTKSPTPMNLNADDLATWIALRDATQAPSWRSCATAELNPCEACVAQAGGRGAGGGNRGIECEVVNGELRITKVALRNNNMKAAGSSLPDLSLWTEVTYFDLSNNVGEPQKNDFSSVDCLWFSQCQAGGGAQCNMARTGLRRGVCSPTVAPTTPVPTSPVVRTYVVDKIAINILRASLNSANWARCNEPDVDPCLDCPDHFKCALQGPGLLRVVEMHLGENRVRGVMPRGQDVFEVGSLSALTLVSLDNRAKTPASKANHLTLAPGDKTCVSWDICAITGTAKCSAAKTGVAFCTTSSSEGATKSPTTPTSQAPTPVQVYADDLAAWQEFWDQLGGMTWVSCGGDAMFRANPCQCAGHVTCIFYQGFLRLAEIILPNNNMVGLFPTEKLTWLPFLRVLYVQSQSLTATNRNRYFNTACLDLPKCVNGATSCNFDFTQAALCPAPRTGSPTNQPTTKVTASPTFAFSRFPPLRASDALAWAEIYSALDGTRWNKCTTPDARVDPCNVCPSAVVCSVLGTNYVNGPSVITGLRFPSSNMRGFFPGEALGKLDKLNVLDFSNTVSGDPDNVMLNFRCFTFDRCYEEGLECVFTGLAVGLCPRTTGSPSSSPSRVPSRSPTVRVVPTKKGVTGAPTTSAAPTTQTPTTGVPTTRTPTTGVPTTQTPTTSVPTTQTPTTSVPTTQTPTTSVPTNKTPTNKTPTTKTPTSKAPSSASPSGNPVVAPTNFPTKPVVIVEETSSPSSAPREPTSASPTRRPTPFPSVSTPGDESENPTASPTSSSPSRRPTSRSPTTTAIPTTTTTTTPTDSPVPSPTEDFPPLRVGDALAWWRLYDLTNGPTWVTCANARENPCELCPRVQCERTVDGTESFIVALRLQANGLEGRFPGTASGFMFEYLLYMDVSNPSRPLLPGTKNNTFSNARCVNMPECFSNVICRFQGTSLTLCPPVTQQPTSRSPTTAAPSSSLDTASPTSPPQLPPLRVVDALAWWRFFDATGGANWTSCTDSRSNPCQTCPRVQCERTYDGAESVIVALRMRSNHLEGRFPDFIMDTFSELVYLDVSNAPQAPNTSLNTFTNKKCLNMRICTTNTVCRFSDTTLELCPTPPPSTSASPTPFLTLSPSTSTPSRSPTKERRMNADDALGFQVLYDALNGTGWVTCQASRNDPCGLVQPNGCAASGLAKRRILCDLVGVVQLESGDVVPEWRIVEIKLQDNRARGRVPDSAFNLMAALELLDFNSPASLLPAPGNDTANVFQNEACLKIPRCVLGEEDPRAMQCSFALTGARVCPAPTARPTTQGETKSPTTPELKASDLVAWQTIFDATGGEGWVSCSTSRLDPCNLNSNGCAMSSFSSKRVVCDMVNGEKRIVEIKLRNNRMRGWAPQPSLDALDALVLLDLSNDEPGNAQTANVFFNTECVTLARCFSTKMACYFYDTTLVLCPPEPDPPTAFPTNSAKPTKRPTAKPTARPLPLVPSDLAAWQQFYDALGGSQWLACRQSRSNPCASDTNGCPNTLDQRIVCAVVLGATRIVEIHLVDARLRGWMNGATVQAMSQLEILDVRSRSQDVVSSNILFNDQCVDLGDWCYSAPGACLLAGTGADVCPRFQGPPTSPTDTFRPTAYPTGLPTKQPSARPTTKSATDPADLAAWRLLYDSLRGESWVDCKTSRDDPCSRNNGCMDVTRHRIVCGEFAGALRITEVYLVDNNLRGWFPVESLSAMAYLTMLDVRTVSPDPAKANILFNQDCLYFQGDLCYEPKLGCLFAGTTAQVCPRFQGPPTSPTDTYSPTAFPTNGVSPTTKPTSRPTQPASPLPAEDLAAWQLVFDSLRGQSWVDCLTSRADPCNAQFNGCVDVTNHRFVCEPVDGITRLVAIYLVDNRLRGYVPEEPMQRLIGSGLRVIDLRSLAGDVAVANILFNDGCLHFGQVCYTPPGACLTQGTGVRVCPWP